MSRFLTVHPVGEELTWGFTVPIRKAFDTSASIDAYWVGSWYSREEGRWYCEWNARDAESIRHIIANAASELPTEGIYKMELIARSEYAGEEGESFQLTAFESLLVAGIIACMLWLTWGLGHLLADKWLWFWVEPNEFVYRRIVLYGVALIMAAISISVTTKLGLRFETFGETVKRAFLWYGYVLLIAAFCIFVFDVLPEVFASIIIVGLFIAAMFFFQKRFLKRR